MQVQNIHHDHRPRRAFMLDVLITKRSRSACKLCSLRTTTQRTGYPAQVHQPRNTKNGKLKGVEVTDGSTLALKTMGKVIRSPKKEHERSHKMDPKIKKQIEEFVESDFSMYNV